MDKLKEIRDALDDDAVFNVVGEVLPAAQVERVLRDYYAGWLGQEDLEDRLLRDVDEESFRSICKTALEGLASRKLNLDLLVERRAKAQEHRIVPETIARFLQGSARKANLDLRPIRGQLHSFEPGATPVRVKRYERAADWNLPEVAARYPRISTDRTTAEEGNLEWVTPGHPLFEALRRHSFDEGREAFAQGACFHSLDHEEPARLDFYRARVVDGLQQTIHEKLFTIEMTDGKAPKLREPQVLGNLTPAEVPEKLPAVAAVPEQDGWLQENALVPFIEGIRKDRTEELQRIADHVELSLTEVLRRTDLEVGRALEDIGKQIQGAEGRLAQAENRHAEALGRRERRRRELEQQQALTLQGVERMTTALVMPHPNRDDPDVRNLKPSEETELTAMRVVMEHEKAQGRQVEDVSAKNLGYDVTSLDLRTGDLKLIEVKGLAAETGTILLSPNEHRVAEDRPECFCLYVVTNCAGGPVLQEPILNPARFEWHEVSKVQHYWLQVDAMTQTMEKP